MNTVGLHPNGCKATGKTHKWRRIYYLQQKKSMGIIFKVMLFPNKDGMGISFSASIHVRVRLGHSKQASVCGHRD